MISPRLFYRRVGREPPLAGKLHSINRRQGAIFDLSPRGAALLRGGATDAAADFARHAQGGATI